MKNKRDTMTVLKGLVASKSKLRGCYRFIHVTEDGIAAASDSHILAYTNKPVKERPGFYNPKTAEFFRTLDNLPYPDFRKLVVKWTPVHFVDDLKEPDEITLELHGVRSKPFEIYRFGEFRYDSKYIKKAIKILRKPYTVEINSLGNLRATDNEFTVVIAPLVWP
jgi:hypothetical protein